MLVSNDISYWIFYTYQSRKKKMSLESERIKLKSLPPTSLHQLNKSFQCFLIDFQQVILQR